MPSLIDKDLKSRVCDLFKINLKVNLEGCRVLTDQKRLTVKLSNLMRTKSKSNRTESNRIETNRIETNRIESKTRKNFLMLKVLELSELFEPNRIESNSEYALNSRVSLYNRPKIIIFENLKKS